jgi:hypothetical protein
VPTREFAIIAYGVSTRNYMGIRERPDKGWSGRANLALTVGGNDSMSRNSGFGWASGAARRFT